MFRGGTVLRLIDVCFIILIGFIKITDLDQKAQLDLPTSGATDTPAPVLALLEIHVAADTENSITDFRERRDGTGAIDPYYYPATSYRLTWEAGNATNQIDSVSEPDLLAQIRRVHSQFSKIEQVVIVPDDETRLEGTVVVYDVCRHLKLPDPAIDLKTEDAP